MNRIVAGVDGSDEAITALEWGRGGFAGLLGSMSQQCVHHAPCPVVVVPSSGRG